MKTAIVTGGAQGIGRAVVERLLGDGWAVAAFDFDAQAVKELAAAHAPRPLLALTLDVADEKTVGAAFDAFGAWLADLGETPGLDLLVSNAGAADPVSGPVEKLSLAGWHKWLDSHLTGGFLMTRAAVPLLRARKGSIILMASTRALQSEPHCEAYAAAKGGLVALAHALAVSLGPDIRVNAILPGWIETGPWAKASKLRQADHRPVDRKQHPVGRVGVPEDIAATVVFLASDGAGFITGQQIVVDGGMTRKMIYAE